MYVIEIDSKNEQSYLAYPMTADKYGNIKWNIHRPHATTLLSHAHQYDNIDDAKRDFKRWAQFVKCILSVKE